MTKVVECPKKNGRLQLMHDGAPYFCAVQDKVHPLPAGCRKSHLRKYDFIANLPDTTPHGKLWRDNSADNARGETGRRLRRGE